MNKQNYQAVLDKIEADPQSWNQEVWHCGTTHCFAGHAQILFGKEANEDTVQRDAREYLDLCKADADYLFSSFRTMEDFKEFFSKEYDSQGYDPDGFNFYGYDRDGFNRHGIDTLGFNRLGLDREGRDRNGYDKDGFNRVGYNREGYDRDGYDNQGLDRNNKSRPE